MTISERLEIICFSIRKIDNKDIINSNLNKNIIHISNLKGDLIWIQII